MCATVGTAVVQVTEQLLVVGFWARLLNQVWAHAGRLRQRIRASLDTGDTYDSKLECKCDRQPRGLHEVVAEAWLAGRWSDLYRAAFRVCKIGRAGLVRFRSSRSLFRILFSPKSCRNDAKLPSSKYNSFQIEALPVYCVGKSQSGTEVGESG